MAVNCSHITTSFFFFFGGGGRGVGDVHIKGQSDPYFTHCAFVSASGRNGMYIHT